MTVHPRTPSTLPLYIHCSLTAFNSDYSSVYMLWATRYEVLSSPPIYFSLPPWKTEKINCCNFLQCISESLYIDLTSFMPHFFQFPETCLSKTSLAWNSCQDVPYAKTLLTRSIYLVHQVMSACFSAPWTKTRYISSFPKTKLSRFKDAHTPQKKRKKKVSLHFSYINIWVRSN